MLSSQADRPQRRDREARSWSRTWTVRGSQEWRGSARRRMPARRPGLFRLPRRGRRASGLRSGRKVSSTPGRRLLAGLQLLCAPLPRARGRRGRATPCVRRNRFRARPARSRRRGARGRTRQRLSGAGARLSRGARQRDCDPGGRGASPGRADSSSVDLSVGHSARPPTTTRCGSSPGPAARLFRTPVSASRRRRRQCAHLELQLRPRVRRPHAAPSRHSPRRAARRPKDLGFAGRQLPAPLHRRLNRVQERSPHAGPLELADRANRRPPG